MEVFSFQRGCEFMSIIRFYIQSILVDSAIKPILGFPTCLLFYKLSTVVDQFTIRLTVTQSLQLDNTYAKLSR